MAGFEASITIWRLLKPNAESLVTNNCFKCRNRRLIPAKEGGGLIRRQRLYSEACPHTPPDVSNLVEIKAELPREDSLLTT